MLCIKLGCFHKAIVSFSSTHQASRLKVSMKLSLLSTFLISMSGLGMSNFVVRKDGLQVDVFHLPAAPVVYQNSTGLSFSPTAFTLISGHHEAILVDASAAHDQGETVADWVKKTIPGKTVKAVYITHGHGDHFFTAPIIQKHFPGAEILSTNDVYQHMLGQYEPDQFAFWKTTFPNNQITSTPFPTKILAPNDIFHLEGHVFRAVEVGQSDTYNSTVLHVPDLDLVVAGDVVYGHCYQYLAESTTLELREQWLKSLDKVAELRPKIVVPSHMQPREGYEPSHVQETKDYIKAWADLLSKSSTWEELEGAVKAKYPDRIGSFILRYSAQVPFGAAF